MELSTFCQKGSMSLFQFRQTAEASTQRCETAALEHNWKINQTLVDGWLDQAQTDLVNYISEQRRLHYSIKLETFATQA